MARTSGRAASRCWAGSPARRSRTPSTSGGSACGSSRSPTRSPPRSRSGIVVGRIGDLIIGDHLGKPSSWLLAWTYEGGTMAPPFTCANDELPGPARRTAQPRGHRRDRRICATPRAVRSRRVSGVHQTALYDMLLAAVLFGVLWWFIRKPPPRGDGDPAVRHLVRMQPAAARTRSGSTSGSGRSPGSQWTALTVVVVTWIGVGDLPRRHEATRGRRRRRDCRRRAEPPVPTWTPDGSPGPG